MVRALKIGVALVIALGASVSAADWPQWRGPHGNGVADEKDLPLRWTATENVAWKADLAGVGVSSPIVAGNRLFVTSQIGAGISRQGPRLAQGAEAASAGERSLTPRAADANRTLFVVEAFDPVTDGQFVYAWFGTGQIVALDINGKLVWERNLAKEISPFDINWGHSSSPTLYEDLLILICDHDPASYLLAVDKKTGKERWKSDRGKGRQSYATPFVVQTASGPELVVNSSQRVDAYDPRNGTLLWYVGGSNQFPIPSPTFHDGVIYMTRGYRSGPYMAIRPGGRGDVSSSHVIWQVNTGAPYISSLVYDGGLLYMANDVGGITVIEADSGKRLWQERVGGLFSASPVAADGKIYFVSETGEVIVLRAGREPAVIARNDIGERLIASPAISNGQIFLRSDGRLIAIGKPRT
jgi:outer membrane protein assembly factor BamB